MTKSLGCILLLSYDLITRGKQHEIKTDLVIYLAFRMLEVGGVFCLFVFDLRLTWYFPHLHVLTFLNSTSSHYHSVFHSHSVIAISNNW